MQLVRRLRPPYVADMASEPGKPQEIKAAPSLKVRLALWFAIYFFGFVINLYMQVAYNTRMSMMGDPDFSPGIGFQQFWVILLTFPFGLAFFLRLPFGFFSGFFLSYATYLLHLYFTYKVKTGRMFVLLMLILVVLVTCNIIGCSENYTPNMAK